MMELSFSGGGVHAGISGLWPRRRDELLAGLTTALFGGRRGEAVELVHVVAALRAFEASGERAAAVRLASRILLWRAVDDARIAREIRPAIAKARVRQGEDRWHVLEERLYELHLATEDSSRARRAVEAAALVLVIAIEGEPVQTCWSGQGMLRPLGVRDLEEPGHAPRPARLRRLDNRGNT